MLDPNIKDKEGLPLTCRAVFIVGPDKKLKLSLNYPASVGRNMDEIVRVIDALQLSAKYSVVRCHPHPDVDVPSVMGVEAHKVPLLLQCCLCRWNTLSCPLNSTWAPEFKYTTITMPWCCAGDAGELAQQPRVHRRQGLGLHPADRHPGGCRQGAPTCRDEQSLSQVMSQRPHDAAIGSRVPAT